MVTSATLRFLLGSFPKSGDTEPFREVGEPEKGFWKSLLADIRKKERITYGRNSLEEEPAANS